MNNTSKPIGRTGQRNRALIGLITIGVVILLSGMIAAGPLQADDDRRPNFLVILCDDLGYGDLGCYGHPSIKTPHLDRLAEEGIRLTDCYSTAPVCSASRAGLLTGKTPTRIGVFDWIPNNHAMHLRSEEITIASLLRDNGYSTSQVGKWHCNGKFNSDQQPQPGDHGFDHWFATQNNAAPSHHNPTNFVRNGEPVGRLEGYSCQIVADEAIRWLRERDRSDRPFFQFVCFHEPHEPIDSPADLVDDYPEATAEGQALYFANVANMDKAVGRLMAALDELDLVDNTFVLFTSDNGPETLNRYRGAWRSHGSPGDLRGMKLHVYDGGIRVAGILRYPPIENRQRMQTVPIGAVDLLPTFCELAGIELAGDLDIDGTSLVPLLQGGDLKRDQPLYWYYYRALGEPKVAMREGDWMLVAGWDAEGLRGGVVQRGHSEVIKSAQLTGFELYHMRADIGQQSDRSADEPERLRLMIGKLQSIHRGVQQDAPIWDLEE